MYEVTFQLKGGGAYTTVTRGRDVSFEVWCNNHCDLLRVSGADRQSIHDEVVDLVGIQQTLEVGEELLIITEECLIEHVNDTVVAYLNEHNCLLLPPLRYRNGAKFCRVVALDSEQLTNLYQTLREVYQVDIVSKKDITGIDHDTPLISHEEVLPDLSQRQQEVFVAAHELGYYEIPRDVTTSEIADRIGIDRRTVEEHLRRAENKIANSIAEYFV